MDRSRRLTLCWKEWAFFVALLITLCLSACSDGVIEEGPSAAESPDELHCQDRSQDSAPVERTGALLPPAVFSVSYMARGEKDPYGMICQDFPQEARAAFDSALARWSGVVRSAVPIRVTACWTDFTVVDPAYAGVTGVAAGLRGFVNFPGTPKPDVCYLKSLANARAGYDLDPQYPDMHVSYNAMLVVPWYFGTDGQPPTGTMDFMHVVAHEVGHGLGLRGSAFLDPATGLGAWGVDGYLLAWDDLVIDGAGQPLSSRVRRGAPSAELSGMLTGGDLWIGSPNARGANGGSPVRLYAPNAWAQGSSFQHLDEATFTGTEDELMIHTFFPGRAVPNVAGPVTVGILKDMGWVTTER